MDPIKYKLKINYEQAMCRVPTLELIDEFGAIFEDFCWKAAGETRATSGHYCRLTQAERRRGIEVAPLRHLESL
jgi:hypothetical protein